MAQEWWSWWSWWGRGQEGLEDLEVRGWQAVLETHLGPDRQNARGALQDLEDLEGQMRCSRGREAQ